MARARTRGRASAKDEGAATGDETKYKGRTIAVRTPESPADAIGAEEPALFVDDQYQLASYEPGSQRYWSYKLPYLDFPSLNELGQALVDHDLAD